MSRKKPKSGPKTPVGELETRRDPIVKALRQYSRLPDPPLPGLEEAQYKKLVALRLLLCDYFSYLIQAFPSDWEEQYASEAEVLISPYINALDAIRDVTKLRRAMVRYDAVRSTVQFGVTLAMQRGNSK